MEEVLRKLDTPCGIVTVADENNEYVPFTVEKNLFNCPYSFESAEGKTIRLTTDTNFTLKISSSDLICGRLYRVSVSGIKLRFGDSDERTECVSGCANGYCIALGSYLPNDDEKMDQALKYSERMGFQHSIVYPHKFDTAKFSKYDAEMLDDCSGFCFYLIDNSVSEICFDVAWIKSDGINDSEYESAVQFWTT